MASSSNSDPRIQLLQLELLNENPGPYQKSFQWRMRVAVSEQLLEPLTVTFVWVGSHRSSEFDQLLDSFDVGPFVPGVSEFQLESDAPRVDLIPPEDVLGVSVLLLSFQYRAQEFLRVGYYTQVAYFDESLNAAPPDLANGELLGRFLVMSQPAVTILPIAWDEEYRDDGQGGNLGLAEQ